MRITATDVADAASLFDWLKAHDVRAQPVLAPGTMGASDTIAVVTAGSITVRGILLVVREWIRAHRTVITLELTDRGKVHIEGPADVDTLIASLREDG